MGIDDIALHSQWTDIVNEQNQNIVNTKLSITDRERTKERRKGRKKERTDKLQVKRCWEQIDKSAFDCKFLYNE